MSQTRYSIFLTDAIEKRIEQYGHPKAMNPVKYRAMLAVRTVIALRMMKHFPGARSLQYIFEEDLPVAMNFLDDILPERKPL